MEGLLHWNDFHIQKNVFQRRRVFSLFFLDLARLDPKLQNRGLVQFLACFLQNVLTIFVDYTFFFASNPPG